VLSNDIEFSGERKRVRCNELLEGARSPSMGRDAWLEKAYEDAREGEPMASGPRPTLELDDACPMRPDVKAERR